MKSKIGIEFVLGAFLIILMIILSNTSTELNRQTAHRERIVNSLFCTVVVCDESGHPVYVSDNLQDQFGWTRHDIMENGIKVLMVSDEYHAKHTERFAEAARLAKSKYLYANTPMRRIVPVRCKDGSIKQSGIRMFTTDIEGKVFMYAIMLPLDVFDTMKSWPKPEINP